MAFLTHDGSPPSQPGAGLARVHHTTQEGTTVTVVRHYAPPTPYSCRWCGIAQQRHGRRWVQSQGVHGWEKPTSAQMLARMKARRTDRAEQKRRHALWLTFSRAAGLFDRPTR